MTLPDPAAPRKPRRGCLTSVIILLLVLAGAYSAGWFWLQREAEQRIDQTAASLRGRGYTVAWDQRTIGGDPFRLDVNFQNLRLREPSGWALAFPQLRTEAFVYAPLHWVADAPAGLTFTRPIGGPVRIQAQALRASSIWARSSINAEGFLR